MAEAHLNTTGKKRKVGMILRASEVRKSLSFYVFLIFVSQVCLPITNKTYNLKIICVLEFRSHKKAEPKENVSIANIRPRRKKTVGDRGMNVET